MADKQKKGQEMDYYTTGDLAEKLGVTDRRVRQLIDEGKIEAEQFGHIWRISADEVKRYLRERE